MTLPEEISQEFKDICGSTAATSPASSSENESDVDDDFDCVAEDVLVPSASVQVLDCNARAGVIEVGGEIYLSLLAVRDGSPVNLDRTVPFRARNAQV